MNAEQASERKSGRGGDSHYSGCGTNVHSGLGVPLQGAVQGLTESSLPAPTCRAGAKHCAGLPTLTCTWSFLSRGPSPPLHRAGPREGEQDFSQCQEAPEIEK